MVNYSEYVTPEVKALLDDIRSIKHGSLSDVELDGTGRATILAELTSSQKALVDLINSGIVSFRTIKIFQGDPSMAEVASRTAKGNYACVETLKLN